MWPLQIDANGTRRSLSPETQGCFYPSLSPDGKQLALACDRAALDIVLGDVQREAFTRWPSEGADFTLIWTPDAAAVTYSKHRDGVWSIRMKRAGRGDSEEILLESEDPLYPSSWSPDGEVLAFQRIRRDTGEDIWLLPADGERRPRPWRNSQHHESGARFSPDGQWIAYHSNESGKWHVHAEKYPGPGGKVQLSSAAGGWPAWSQDGTALVYLAGRLAMPMIVGIEPGPELVAARPRPLLEEGIAAIRY